jgi:hypothetical protein
MNALAGLTGYSLHVGLDLHLTVTVTCGAIVGSAIGGLLSGYVKPELLRPSFGALVVLVAGYVLYQAVTMELLITAKQWLLNPQNPGWAIASLVLLWRVLRIGSWIHKSDTAILPRKIN